MICLVSILFISVLPTNLISLETLKLTTYKGVPKHTSLLLLSLAQSPNFRTGEPTSGVVELMKDLTEASPNKPGIPAHHLGLQWGLSIFKVQKEPY